MPELPEVETTRLGIEPYLIGSTFKDLVIRQRQLRWLIPKNLRAKLLKQRIINVSRRGKYLLIDTTNGSLIMHLGMSGTLRIVNKDHSISKHDHADFLLSNQKILRFNDPRRFGAILWTKDDPFEHKLLVKLGVEPLTVSFSGKMLYAASRNKSVAIKSFLMDGKVVVGVGNIYATEALYSARISPLRKAKEINLDEYCQLAKDIKKILRRSIKLGGTTLKDFVNSDNKPGYFQQTLQVYGKADKPCPSCSTDLIQIRQNQRATVYCEKCQL